MIYTFSSDLRRETQWNKGLCFARSYFIPFSGKGLCSAASPDKEISASDRVFSLSGTWDFCLDDGKASSFDSTAATWTPTEVPSYWKAEDSSNGACVVGSKKAIPRGIYRTFFSVYNTNDTHFLSFTRVGGAFDAYVNGVFCGRSMTGAGEFDLSSLVKEGENELLVVVYAFCPADVFFCGGTTYHGITGDVVLSAHPAAASLVDYSFES
ncbi:MAG: hypothetical protein J5781_03975, partial [Clostridia bacterium]|nr:hypothetical protein [Clostridia bacterium]